MKRGYGRVSKGDGLSITAQTRALTRAGCKEVYCDRASGAIMERPKLQIVLSRLQPGDVLVVWRFDRLSRSLLSFAKILSRVEAARATLISLTEKMDTSTSSGRLQRNVIMSFAEHERDANSERTKEALNVARAAGRYPGRRPKLRPDQQAVHVATILSGEKTVPAAAHTAGVSVPTMNRYLKAARDAIIRKQNEGRSRRHGKTKQQKKTSVRGGGRRRRRDRAR